MTKKFALNKFWDGEKLSEELLEKKIRLLTFGGKLISKHIYKSPTTQPPRLNSVHRHVTPNSSGH